MVEEIIIDIGPDGNVEIKGKGFVGSSCSGVIGPLAADLGVTVEHKKTAEFYKKVAQKQVQKRGNG